MDILTKLDKELKELMERKNKAAEVASRAHTAAKHAEHMYKNKLREIRRVETKLGVVDERREMRSNR